MKFSNGDPVDAKAAKASLEHYRDGAGPGAAHLTGIDVKTVDDRKLTITLPAPDPLLTTYLTGSPGALASPKQLDSPNKATTPIGSGPYTYIADKSASGTNVVYQRNKNYWNLKGYPYDSIELRILPDETARLNALQSGQINATAVGLSTVAQAQKAGLQLAETKSVWAGVVIADRAGSIVPALGDVRVRRAINMVFDRNTIMKSLLQGRGSPSTQIFNPATDAYSKDLDDRYPFDVQAAKALMAEAGYSGGFDIKLPEITGNAQSAFDPVVVQQLGLLNIRATVEAIPPNQALRRYLGGEFPLFLYILPAGTPAQVVDGYIAPKAIWNTSHAVDPELTPLLQQIKTAEGAEATKLYQQINKRVTDQAWFANWGHLSTYWATDHSTSVSYVVGNPTPHVRDFK
jgi:peptide/nickel transport system substrate-binding protein